MSHNIITALAISSILIGCGSSNNSEANRSLVKLGINCKGLYFSGKGTVSPGLKSLFVFYNTDLSAKEFNIWRKVELLESSDLLGSKLSLSIEPYMGADTSHETRSINIQVTNNNTQEKFTFKFSKRELSRPGAVVKSFRTKAKDWVISNIADDRENPISFNNQQTSSCTPY